ncbi:MAG: hypothetical protein GXO02_01000, partial [Epsilonproteobacteria bacterium]|nr:hypothetical protein [Campylobacterota bacterium]
MWAEKKALRRFVFIYLFSTLILIGFGEWFYYQKRIFTLRESQIHKIESQIKLFLANNKKAFHKCIFLNKCDEIKPSFDMAILKNKKIVYKNFDFKEVLKKRYKIKDGYIYYLFNIPKKDLPIEILARSRVDKSGIKKLWHELIIFNLFVVVF